MLVSSPFSCLGINVFSSGSQQENGASSGSTVQSIHGYNPLSQLAFFYPIYYVGKFEFIPLFQVSIP